MSEEKRSFVDEFNLHQYQIIKNDLARMRRGFIDDLLDAQKTSN